MCIGAGILVGILNYGISRLIIVRFLAFMIGKIHHLRDRLSTYHEKQELACAGADCHLNIVSADTAGILTAIDELTGVFKRRIGIKRLNEDFDRSRRYSLPLSGHGGYR